MTTSSGLDRLHLLRDAGAVTRFHTSRIRAQRLSEHSHGVVELILAVRPDASSALLIAALRHDVYELFTGDMPATTKWANPELAYALSKVEGALDADHQLVPKLEEADQLLLKWADMMELVLYTFEELKGGNRYASTLMWNGLDALKTYKLGETDAPKVKALEAAIRLEIKLWSAKN